MRIILLSDEEASGTSMTDVEEATATPRNDDEPHAKKSITGTDGGNNFLHISCDPRYSTNGPGSN